MMYGSDVFCHEPCLLQIRCSLESNSERMQAWPVCSRLAVVFNAILAEMLCYGRNDAAVETSTEENAVRHIAHQLPLDGLDESTAYILRGCRVVLHRVIIHPIALIVSSHTRALSAPEIMTRQEGFIAFALSLKSFQF